jgi:hypothetical protein
MLISLTVAQSDYMNFDQNDLPNPLDIGLPPLSREGLIDCDEYSPNYEKPCTARSEAEQVWM